MWSGASGSGSSGTPPTLSVVVVNWNVRRLLAACLRSVKRSVAASGIATEYIVVDNASTDGSPEMVRAEFPAVRLLALEENRGYAAGVNCGLRVAQGRYVLVLNPDTEAVGDAVGSLVRFLEDHPAVGVVGPALVYPDGSPQPSRRRFHPLPVLFFQDTSLHALAVPWLNRFFMADQPADTPHPVDWLVGAVLCVRREVVETVGGMDEAFFMYFEEADWLRRVKAAGWSVWFVPQATFVHHEGASSGQVVPARHLRYARSRICYAARWHGERTARLLWAWLLVHFGWQLVLEGGKLCLGHKPALRRERVAAYRFVLRSLWKAKEPCASSS